MDRGNLNFRRWFINRVGGINHEYGEGGGIRYGWKRGGGIYLICIERDTFLTAPTFYPSDRFYKAGNKTNRVKGGFQNGNFIFSEKI